MPLYDASFPSVVRIESVGRCNFKCIHCPTGTEPNNRNALTEKNFHSIIEQFHTYQYVPRVAVLYHGGEPLLNKKLEYFIQVLKEIGVTKTVITTNASLLDEKRSESLIQAGLDEVKVSFDGESPEENNYIRKNGDFYDNAERVKNLIHLKKQLNKSNPNVIISNVRICDKNTIQNLIQYEEYTRKANLKEDYYFEQLPGYLREFFKEELDSIEFRSFPAMVWPGLEKYEQFEEITCDKEKPTYCDTMFETFSILTNGDVVQCCYDLPGELVLGNVFEKSMFDIWMSPKYINIRESFKKAIYNPVCAKCHYVNPRYLCKADNIVSITN